VTSEQFNVYALRKELRRHEDHPEGHYTSFWATLRLSEVNQISYNFKPRTQQVDKCGEAVNELRLMPGLSGVKLSHFMEYAVERSLREYRSGPDKYGKNLRDYLNWRNGGGDGVHDQE
jgi:hypothetical protein